MNKDEDIRKINLKKRPKNRNGSILPIVTTRNERKILKQKYKKEVQLKKMRTLNALYTGEEKYLPDKDKGQQKRFVRNFIDLRFSICEYSMPVGVIFVFLSFLAPTYLMQLWILIIFWLYFLIVFVEMYILSRKLKYKLKINFNKLDKGLIRYGIIRSIQMKRMRLPRVMNKNI